MKTLEPRTIQEYRCDFCNKKYRSKGRCEAHEKKCFKNPDRDCETCDNEGVEFFSELGENLGVIPDARSEDCSSCKIASELGGKSYIEKEK